MRHPRALALALAAAVGGAGLAAVGWTEATQRPVVVAYDVVVAGWPPGMRPLRIVQLSDIHLGPPDMPAARVAAIVAQVNALHPDLIALTGDYHGGKWHDAASGNLDDAIRPLAKLRSRLGTFAVRGNHDEAYWSPRVLPRYHMTYLENRWVDAGPVIVAGLDDLSDGHADLTAALAGVPPRKPVLLLMHEPDSFARLAVPVALALAGHTHGGQIAVPLIGALLVNSPEGYIRGRYVEHGRTLIVSSGVGTTALPIRLGVPPEIVVVTLHAR